MKKNSRTGILLLLFLVCGIWMYTPVCAANVIQKADENAKTLAKGKLIQEGKRKIRYRYSGTKKYAEKLWVRIDSGYYYFDKKGYAKTGWFTYRKKTYYASPVGRVFHDRWKTVDGKKYYLRADGTMAANCFVTKGDSTWRFTTKGVLVTNRMYEIKGKTYFSKADGTLLKNRWLRTTSGKRYYFDQNGERLEKQWVFYKGKYYYFMSTGAMAVNKTIGKYKVGEDGARIIERKRYVFVGDSRVVGMEAAVSGANTSFIGKVSMGYSWMISSALPQLERLLKSDPTMYVVLCFGINDLGNVGSYISAYRNLVAKYKYANFFFMSVNPVNYAVASAHGYRVTNTQIEAFNSRLADAMGFRYLNTYSWLQKNGFQTSDGIHYTASTYRRLYEYAVSKIG